MNDPAKSETETDVETGEDGQKQDQKTAKDSPAHKLKQAPGEINGPSGPEPTRYGDWENKGICSDF
ncbi:MAG: DUF1674 domain-containing protein [Minwuiales bacterium]|nr:DUF1674 domain-containing protein [Minwuiales bacterium]